MKQPGEAVVKTHAIEKFSASQSYPADLLDFVAERFGLEKTSHWSERKILSLNRSMRKSMLADFDPLIVLASCVEIGFCGTAREALENLHHCAAVRRHLRRLCIHGVVDVPVHCHPWTFVEFDSFDRLTRRVADVASTVALCHKGESEFTFHDRVAKLSSPGHIGWTYSLYGKKSMEQRNGS